MPCPFPKAITTPVRIILSLCIIVIIGIVLSLKPHGLVIVGPAKFIDGGIPKGSLGVLDFGLGGVLLE